MTKKEAGKIVYTIRAVYPQSFMRYTEQDVENLLQAWAAVLGDYTYAEVSAGLNIYLAADTKGFPPSPGQVIDCITKATKSSDLDLTPMEAWSCVLRAARNSNYHAAEEFDNLPLLCRRAIGSPEILKEIGQMDASVVNSVEQSNFIRAYESAAKRMLDESKIPQSVRRLMGKTFGQLEGSDQKRLEEAG